MGDMGEIFRALKDERKELRDKFGVECPGCIAKFPKRNPTILLPGYLCRVCGYADKRKKDQLP